jgi:hypothetical protein
LTVSQTYWCITLTQILTSDESVRQKILEDFEQTSYTNLNKLAALVRQELPQVKSKLNSPDLESSFLACS